MALSERAAGVIVEELVKEAMKNVKLEEEVAALKVEIERLKEIVKDFMAGRALDARSDRP